MLQYVMITTFTVSELLRESQQGIKVPPATQTHTHTQIHTHSQRLRLIKCFVDMSFKVCNNWKSFHNDIEKIKSNLIKKAYPQFLIYKFIKKYLDHKFPSNQNQLKDTTNVCYAKLPYIGKILYYTKN